MSKINIKNTAIKPCPSCGNTTLEFVMDNINDDQTVIAVQCCSCGQKGPDINAADVAMKPRIASRLPQERIKAITAWNTMCADKTIAAQKDTMKIVNKLITMLKDDGIDDMTLANGMALSGFSEQDIRCCINATDILHCEIPITEHKTISIEQTARELINSAAKLAALFYAGKTVEKLIEAGFTSDNLAKIDPDTISASDIIFNLIYMINKKDWALSNTAAKCSHYRNLLNSVVDYTAVAENTSGQIKELRNMGFEREDLLEFNYSESDIDNAEEENEWHL